MKFLEIKIGDQFEYQGERYQKISPLIASCLNGGKQKLFSRATLVQSLSQIQPAAPASKTAEAPINREALYKAIENYHQKNITILNSLALEPSLLLEATKQMGLAKTETYQALNLPVK